MNPRIVANQQRRFLEFLGAVRSHVPRDAALPRRIREVLAHDRKLGSRDRRLYRELIFTALRFWPWIEPRLDSLPEVAAKLTAWLAADLKDTQAYRAVLCADWPPPPASLRGKAETLEKLLPAGTFAPEELLPAWFRPHCPAAFVSPHLDALLTRAPLWVRLQTADPAPVLEEFQRRGWSCQPLVDVPDALRLTANADVGGTEAFRQGLVELQDLGSQLILRHAAIAPGETWLDACAGAGGKTLQLARLVGAAGRVDATDVRAEALEELGERSRRARLANVQVVAQPAGDYDGVLVDAPCSGSGTWRRAPHLKWSTSPEIVARHSALQLRLLLENSVRVRPGGTLVYATCSLSARENHDVAAAFVSENRRFRAVPAAGAWGGVADALGSTLLPGTRDTDGFYVAVFRRTQ